MEVAELRLDKLVDVNEEINKFSFSCNRKLFNDDDEGGSMSETEDDDHRSGQYIQIKTNKPYGSCPVYTSDLRSIHACDCIPELGVICDEESSCINRQGWLKLNVYLG